MVPIYRSRVHGGSVSVGQRGTQSLSTVRPSTGMWQHTHGEQIVMPERHLDVSTASIVQSYSGQMRQEQIRHHIFSGLHVVTFKEGGGMQSVENCA